MANQLASLPLLIDTVSNTPLFTGFLAVDHFAYVNYAGAGDVVEVYNDHGDLVWVGKGRADGTTVESEHRTGWIDGLTVPLLTSLGGPNMANGQLLVYLK